jgi:hypothetical protein
MRKNERGILLHVDLSMIKRGEDGDEEENDEGR